MPQLYSNKYSIDYCNKAMFMVHFDVIIILLKQIVLNNKISKICLNTEI